MSNVYNLYLHFQRLQICSCTDNSYTKVN